MKDDDCLAMSNAPLAIVNSLMRDRRAPTQEEYDTLIRCVEFGGIRWPQNVHFEGANATDAQARINVMAAHITNYDDQTPMIIRMNQDIPHQVRMA